MDEDRIRAVGLPLCIALLSLIAQWALYDRAAVPMDEGHLAAAASWMLDGKQLYRDIHSGIFPGIYLITAGLFALFGEDMWVMRAAAVVMNGVTALVLFWIARRMVRPHWALLAPGLHMALVVVGFPVLSIFNYSTLAVCFGLVALLFLLRYLERGALADAIGLGLFLAASVLTKQNFGFLVFTSLLASLLLCRRESAIRERSLSSALLAIAITGASLTLAVAIFFVVKGSFLDGLDSTVVSLAGSQLRDFNNPIPPLFGAHPAQDSRFVFLYTPPTVFNAMLHGEPWAGIPVGPALRSISIRASYGIPILVTLVALPVLFLTRSWDESAAARANRSAVLFGVLFFPGIFPSAIWSHLAFVLVPLLPVMVFLADRAESALGRIARGSVWPIRALQGTTAVLVLVAAFLSVRLAGDVARWNPVALDMERASLRVSARQAALLRGAVRFVDECAAEDEPILAIPDIPIVYFLADRGSPSPYDLTIPGHVDGALIARRIEEVPIRCIVMNPHMYPEFAPFKVLFPGLAQEIERSFVGVELIGEGSSRWVGLVRRRTAAH